jgi:molybdate transport system ATP-binding protein
MTPDPVFLLDHATIVRTGGAVVFRDLTWTVREGETWGIVGPTGSGKTTLADVILGQHHVEAGTIAWPLLDRLRAAGRPIAWAADVIRCVAFKEDSRLFSYGRHYYQQRFNFIEPQDDISLDTFLRSGIPESEDALTAAARRLGIDSLRSLSLIKLSNGQIRRARIARALLSHPEWLLLDDPFMGLDSAGRGEVAELLGNLVREGLRILLITRPEAIPDWVTHVLEVDRLGVSRQDPRAKYQARLPRTTPTAASSAPQPVTSDPIIEMRHVNVAYGDRAILRDITWTVRAGERWAVLGPNGSGKSTLLSLICGDHPQAYCNDIRLFGRQRGSGESIWDIKRNIGLVSPELHLYFSEPLTASQTAATGFFDVLARRRTTPEQDTIVRELFDFFALTALAGRPFARLSTGEQRLVLLIRALVKRPPVLILDEPFQGLDGEHIVRLRDWLDQGLGSEQTLLFVSHHPEEIPHTVSRRLRLEQGRVVEISAY